MKNEIKEIMVIVILGIVAIIIAYLCELFQRNQIFTFTIGSLYMILAFIIYNGIVDNEPEPEQSTEIMYFEKTSELQEWTEKLKKEEVEVIYYGTVWNALVKHRDMITQDKVNNYCIIYKYN
jgi:membrane protein implicated in regulation of membrane protease activity